MARLFLGNLGSNYRDRELERLFRGYGRCKFDLKGVYGFVDIDDWKDATDAVRDIDGKLFNGGR